MTFDEVRNYSASIIAKYFNLKFDGVDEMPEYDKAYDTCFETPLEFCFTLNTKDPFSIEDIKTLRKIGWRPGCSENLGTQEDRDAWADPETSDAKLAELVSNAIEMSIVKRQNYDFEV